MNAKRKHRLGIIAALLCCTPLTALAAAAPRASAANPYLTSAVRLYNDLEFDAALAQLHKAEKFSTGPRDDIAIHAYEGIVELANGQADKAEADFKVALSLNLTAQLPQKVSPKTHALWEKVRADLAKQKPAVRPAPPTVTATPAPADVPHRAPAPALTSSAPAAPAGGLTAHAPEVKSAGSSWPAWTTLGAGVVLGGVGGYLGLHAHQLGTTAQSDLFQKDADADLQSARSNATASYILLGAAGVAVAAGITWLVLGSHGGGDADTASASNP